MNDKKVRWSPRKTKVFLNQGNRWILLPGGGFGLERPREPGNPKTPA